MDRFLEEEYVVKLILLTFATGAGVRLLLWGYYKRLLAACSRMNSTKHAAIRHMREQFINRYQADFGVHNVDIFVDRYLANCRLFGILLSTWENICGQTLWQVMLFAAVGAFLSLLRNLSDRLILSTMFAGIAATALLILLDGLGQIRVKKRRLRLQLRDYLENCFQVRLESEFENLKKESTPKNRERIAKAQLAITDEALYRKLCREEEAQEKKKRKQEARLKKAEERQKKQKERRARLWAKRTERSARRMQKKEQKRSKAFFAAGGLRRRSGKEAALGGWDEEQKERLRAELAQERRVRETKEAAMAAVKEEPKTGKQAEKLVQLLQEDKHWEELIEEVLQEYLA